MGRILLVLVIPLCFADSATLQGHVVDRLTKEPLYGAKVVIEGTGLTSVTRSDGGFSISDLDLGTFVVRSSYVGQETRIDTVQITTFDQVIDLNVSLLFRGTATPDSLNPESTRFRLVSNEAYHDSIGRLAREGWLSPTTQYWFRHSLSDLAREGDIAFRSHRHRKRDVYVLDSDTLGGQECVFSGSRLRIIPVNLRSIDSLARVRTQVTYTSCKGVYVESEVARAIWRSWTARFNSKSNQVVHTLGMEDDFRYRRRKTGWYSCGHMIIDHMNIEMP